MAVQVLHSGNELYSNIKTDVNIGEIAHSLVDAQIKLDEAYWKIKEDERKWAEGIMTFQSGDMVLKTVQDAVSKEIDGFISLVKEKYGTQEVLGNEDKLEMYQKKVEIQNKITGLQSKMARYVEVKNMVGSNPNIFDIEKSYELFKKFEEDPLNNSVPNPVLAPVDFISGIVEELNKSNPIRQTEYGETTVQKRIGTESKDKQIEIIEGIIQSNNDISYALKKKYSGINSATELAKIVVNGYGNILFPETSGYRNLGGSGGGSSKPATEIMGSTDSNAIGIKINKGNEIHLGADSEIAKNINTLQGGRDLNKLMGVVIGEDKITVMIETDVVLSDSADEYVSIKATTGGSAPQVTLDTKNNKKYLTNKQVTYIEISKDDITKYKELKNILKQMKKGETLGGDGNFDRIYNEFIKFGQKYNLNNTPIPSNNPGPNNPSPQKAGSMGLDWNEYKNKKTE